MSASKVFCIGLNKTGTISLHQALEMLGLRSLHWGGPAIRAQVEANAIAGRPLLDGLDDHDAYSDIAALSERYELLDQQYPDSRFILTTRPLEEWIASREAHVARNRERAERGEYTGDFLTIDPAAWRTEFTDHHQAVASYFAGRDDFLTMRITEGDGFDGLCDFLGMAMPTEPFPHRHRGRKTDPKPT